MKEFIQEVTFSNLLYLLFNSLTIVGLLFASVTSLWMSDLDILNQSYERNPVIKFHEDEKGRQILNIPLSIMEGHIKDSTSLFIGFITSFCGTTLNLLFESNKGTNKVQMNIILIIMCVFLFCILRLLVFIICKIRIRIIKYRILKNKIPFPNVYSAYETDNRADKGICVRMQNKRCEVELKLVEDEK